MSKKYTYEYIKEYIENIGYKLLSSEYTGVKNKLLIECDKGHDVFMAFASFKSGRRCKTCSYKEMGEKRKMHYEDVKKYIESFGYELISKEYVNINDPLKIKCPYGYEYKLSFNNFKNNNKCPYINPTRKKTLEEVKNEFAKEGYEVLSEEYINSKQKLKVKCDKGHIIYMTRNDFLEGSRCKICNMSKGERKIEKLLKSNNINFIFDQPYFDDLLSPYGNPLRPDFIIPDRKIWIEYDGEFHYKNCYEEDGHEKITINDKIKNKYAKENNWKLIRIPYWEFENINKILEKELKL